MIIIELDLSRFITEKVNDMSYLFYLCSSLASLDLSYFKTYNNENTNINYDIKKEVNISNLEEDKETIYNNIHKKMKIMN